MSTKGTIVLATTAAAFLALSPLMSSPRAAADVAVFDLPAPTGPARAARPYYRADIQDTRHLDFSDMVFWGGPLRERPVLGSIAPLRITEITRRLVREYFDQTLLGKRSALLAGTAAFPEATVRSLPLPRIIGGGKR